MGEEVFWLHESAGQISRRVCRRARVCLSQGVHITPSLDASCSWCGSDLVESCDPAAGALKAGGYWSKRGKLKVGTVHNKLIKTIISWREGPSEGKQEEFRAFKLLLCSLFCPSQPSGVGQQASVFGLPYGLLAHTISWLTAGLMSKFWLLLVLLMQ